MYVSTHKNTNMFVSTHNNIHTHTCTYRHTRTYSHMNVHTHTHRQTTLIITNRKRTHPNIPYYTFYSHFPIHLVQPNLTFSCSMPWISRKNLANVPTSCTFFPFFFHVCLICDYGLAPFGRFIYLSLNVSD